MARPRKTNHGEITVYSQAAIDAARELFVSGDVGGKRPLTQRVGDVIDNLCEADPVFYQRYQAFALEITGDYYLGDKWANRFWLIDKIFNNGSEDFSKDGFKKIGGMLNTLSNRADRKWSEVANMLRAPAASDVAAE